MKNYYDILHVDRGATAETITAQYRRLAAGLHPDKHRSEAEYNKMMRTINEA